MENTKTTFRPILFSTPMVQAILENRKTMTRRTKGLEEINSNPNDWTHFHTTPDDKYFNFKHINHATMEIQDWYRSVKIPNQVGDVFWVRETFYPFGTDFIYKANPLASDLAVKWKPSIFMPKEACRIFLKIKAIRVERLQNISEEDAISEGVNCLHPFYEDYLEKASFFHLASNSFLSLWAKINGFQSFENNPYVFVYEFEQIEKPLNFIQCSKL